MSSNKDKMSEQKQQQIFFSFGRGQRGGIGRDPSVPPPQRDNKIVFQFK
jgi:hypothetical protein